MQKFSRRSAFGFTAGALAAASEGRASAISAAERRREEAYKIRTDAAREERDLPIPDHVSNGDEARYASRIGNFSKGLPHNELGEVNLNAYTTLLNALDGAT